MLFQVHHQFKHRTEICGQIDVKSLGELNDFIQEIKKSHPLPQNARWMCCEENSKYFVKTYALKLKD